ncbi:hypothetical protein PRBRB14_16210 [Hallella multisaccharivorax DSM 17128]|uniref:ABC transporter domain-containing protein n=1 Tax=Hallella multisaccharivorax DSM 17128 TaxID=688246 RepID=F8NBL8_9BACT|nr:ATP-binding cassette domain-containing protein [Hallella multisaccharivorax]EGN57980.1 hypothetical protein Premu_2626 [Hallella multisaccharivorax DSM 17128]GJG30742.1 hypothetical protein PRBRB14_16210 [Hallella multisaccharivorax DSM 17128]
MLEFKDVSVALRGGGFSPPFSLIVEDGERVCLHGGPHTGKSRILLAALGLCPLASGFITLDGELISLGSAPYFRTMMAYVPQALPEGDITLAEICRSLQVNVDKLTEIKAEQYSQKFSDFESAVVQKLLLSVASLLDRKILLVDNVIPSYEVDALLGKIAARGIEIIYTCKDSRLSFDKEINLSI